MTAQSVIQPFATFNDLSGKPLDAGYLYVGTANQNPETSPIQVYFDEALTIPAAQPIRTVAGYPARNGSPAQLYVDADSFSLTVKDKKLRLVTTTLDAVGVFALRAQLEGSGGSAVIGFIQSGAGAVARTLQDKGREAVSAEDFGAVGDGTTDDAAAFAAALATGRPVRLQKHKTYAFGTQLQPPSNSGIIGGGTLKMLTGPGKFDASSYGAVFATNATGVFIDARENVDIDANFIMEANGAVRVCNPVSVRSSTNVNVLGSCSGFKEAQVGLLSWDSNIGGYVRWYPHDCTPDSNTLSTIQLSGLEIDNNRVSSINSVGLVFDVYAKNLKLGATAVAAYGEQSDAVNIQSQGYSGMVGRVTADTVGEPLDVFGDGNVVMVSGRNCYAYGLKLIHGASDNVIHASIERTVGHGVVYGGSNTASKTVRNNVVIASVKDIGVLGAFANASAVATDGSSATFKPEYNRTRITAHGDGVNMDYVVFEESGSNNTYEADGTGFALQFGIVTGTAGAGNVIRRMQSTSISAATTVATSVSNGGVIPYDTEQFDALGEYDPATYTFTARCHGRYLCHAQIRIGNLPAGNIFGIQIQRNGSALRRNAPVNPGASGKEHYAQISEIVRCNAGDTIRFACVTDTGGPVTITNNSEFTYMFIEQL